LKEKEFLDLVNSHQNIIHKICFVYCRSREDKQDLHQEIILQLWKSFPNFKGLSSFSTWMYRTALNTAITMTKKSKLQTDPAWTDMDIFAGPEQHLEMNEDLKVLYAAIG